MNVRNTWCLGISACLLAACSAAPDEIVPHEIVIAGVNIVDIHDGVCG